MNIIDMFTFKSKRERQAKQILADIDIIHQAQDAIMRGDISTYERLSAEIDRIGSKDPQVTHFDRTADTGASADTDSSLQSSANQRIAQGLGYLLACSVILAFAVFLYRPIAKSYPEFTGLVAEARQITIGAVRELFSIGGSSTPMRAEFSRGTGQNLGTHFSQREISELRGQLKFEEWYGNSQKLTLNTELKLQEPDQHKTLVTVAEEP